jgi:hypothetical protein
MGGMLGWKLSGSVLPAIPAAAAVIALVYRLSGILSEWGADGARGVLMPSGRSTPSRHGFSQADACIMQRRPADAVPLLEAAAMDDPADPEAYLRLARLHRDQLGDPRRAIEWFGHARATHRLTPGERRRVDDELAALRATLDADPSNPG